MLPFHFAEAERLDRENLSHGLSQLDLEVGSISTRVTLIESKVRELEILDSESAILNFGKIREETANCCIRVESFNVVCKGLEKQIAEIGSSLLTSDRTRVKVEETVERISRLLNNLQLSFTHLKGETDRLQSEQLGLSETAKTLDASMTRKYLKVHEEVISILSKMRLDHDLEVKRLVESHLATKSISSRGEQVLTSVVRSSQRLIANLRFESLSGRFKHSVLQSWWSESCKRIKQKIHLGRLAQILLAPLLTNLHEWRFQISVLRILRRVNDEMDSIPSQMHVMIEKYGIRERLDFLESATMDHNEDLSALKAEAIRLESLSADNRTKFEDICGSMQMEKVKVAVLDNNVQEAHTSMEICREMAEKAHVLARTLSEKLPQPTQYATTEEFRNLFSDVVSMWKSIKEMSACQLDERHIIKIIDERIACNSQTWVRADELNSLLARVKKLEDNLVVNPVKLTHQPESGTVLTQTSSVASMRGSDAISENLMKEILDHARSVLRSCRDTESSQKRTAAAERPKSALITRGQKVPSTAGWGAPRHFVT
jgi:hypothetical protein